MKLIYLSAAFLLGVLVGSRLGPDSLPLFIAAALLALSLILLRRYPVALYIAIVMVLALGLGRGAQDASRAEEGPLSQYHGAGEVEVEGVIASYPEPREAFSQFRFDVTAVRFDGTREQAMGKVLVRARPSPDMVSLREPPYFRYGDSLRLTGRLEEPPVLEQFDWREHLAREGVHSLMFRPQTTFLESGQGFPPLAFLYGLREDMASGLARALPQPQASLSHAMLLGLRSTLPSELREDLAETGTTHLIAISGLHMAIMVGFVAAFTTRIFGRSRRWYILVPLVFIWGYALLTGMAPPVFRAAIMGTLFLWALYLGRQRSGIVAMSAAAAVMVAIDPDILEEVSFQLSFLAMAGLILLAPWFQAGGRSLLARVGAGDGWIYSLALLAIDGAAISLAAILATLPIIAFNFHMISLVGLPATLLILPALPIILLASLLVALVGLFIPAIAPGLGWIAWPWLTYMVGVVEAFSWVPALSIDAGPAGVPLAWTYYAVAGLALWLAHRRWGGYLSRSGAGITLTGLPQMTPGADNTIVRRPTMARGAPGPLLSWRLSIALLAVYPLVFLSIALAQPSDRLRVTFLDVGQGDSILVQTPSKQTILIDGGPAPGALALELGQRLPMWERTLDLVVLTHPDSDHVAGLIGVLDRYTFEQVLQCGIDCTTEGNQSNYQTWYNALQREGINMLEAAEGQRIDLNDGIEILVLHPPPNPLAGTEADANNNSVVLRLTYGQVSFLFPADIESFAERYLVRHSDSLDSTVLKVAHHGSKTSTTPEFLAEVDPIFAVISVGADNLFGHPHPQTLATLMETLAEERILLTSERGTIQFETDGRRIWLKPDR